jgi:integrase
MFDLSLVSLLESIPISKKPANDTGAVDQPDFLGLRERALIAIMVYSFARIGAVIQMKVGDYFVQGRRRWVCLHEKGGKEHDVPCHHHLDQCLHDYIEAAGIETRIGNHTFRATGITAYLKNSGKLEVAQ